MSRAALGGLGLALGAGIVPTAAGQTRDWAYDGSGDWSEAAKWTPQGTPRAWETVRLGLVPDTQHCVVRMDADATVDGLRIRDGSLLTNVGHRLNVSDLASISGEYQRHGVIRPAELHIHNGAHAIDMRTGELTISDHGELHLVQGAVVQIDERLSIGPDCYFIGGGDVRIWGGDTPSLYNNGIIYVHSINLELSQFGAGRFDLDGAGDGRIYFNPIGAGDLVVNGTGLTDSFTGRIDINVAAALEMNLSEGWEADAQSTISIDGYWEPGPRVIRGGEFTLAGLLEIEYGEPHLRIESETTVAPTAVVTIDHGGLLEFDGAARMLGGSFTLEEDAIVKLDGPTEWAGEVQTDGVFRQVGDATVTGPTVLEAAVFDLDGGGSTSWTIAHQMVLYADAIDYLALDWFEGTMSIAGGFLGGLTLHLSDPSGVWGMAGELEMIGDPNVLVTRLGGSGVYVSGSVSVSNKVRVSADTTLGAGSVLSFASPAAILQLQGESLVEAGAAFVGGGTLQASGELVLEDGASLGATALQNRGVLRVADGAPGSASAARFESIPGAAWAVDIGGPIAGEEHDVLIVDGDVQLGGSIQVSLVDVGGGVFLPQIGDSFEVLVGSMGVSGAFLADPVSFAGGNVYEWRVVYGPSAVRLEVDQVFECAADFNEDGVVNTIDLIGFLNAWNAQLKSADFNRDGQINTLDLILFLNFWTASC